MINNELKGLNCLLLLVRESRTARNTDLK